MTFLSRLAALCALVLCAMASPAFAEDQAIREFSQDWRLYKTRFLQADGRIVDTGNRGISHSEGQGTGMVFAVHAKDRAAFDRIWTWTRANLQRPDGLFSWRYDPSAADPVSDRNNATDGDLLIAWALRLAQEEWGGPGYGAASAAITRTIERDLIVAQAGKLLLLPAKDHFVKPDGVRVNPSYYVFPAMDGLAEKGQAQRLARAAKDGVRILSAARFGTHRLPADWLNIEKDGAARLSPDNPSRFGYEAIRIPLYLVWARRDDYAQIAPFCAAWRLAAPGEPPPAWFDLRSGQTAPYVGSRGFLAVKQLTEAACANAVSAGVTLPRLQAGDDYYSASLLLFAQLATHARLS